MFEYRIVPIGSSTSGSFGFPYGDDSVQTREQVLRTIKTGTMHGQRNDAAHLRSSYFGFTTNIADPIDDDVHNVWYELQVKKSFNLKGHQAYNWLRVKRLNPYNWNYMPYDADDDVYVDDDQGCPHCGGNCNTWDCQQ